MMSNRVKKKFFKKNISHNSEIINSLIKKKQSKNLVLELEFGIFDWN